MLAKPRPSPRRSPGTCRSSATTGSAASRRPTSGRRSRAASTTRTPSGIYLGNWNSSGEPGCSPAVGIEMDFYGGWKKTFGDIGLDVGTIYYYYPNAENSTRFRRQRQVQQLGDLHRRELEVALGEVLLRVSDYFGPRRAGAAPGLEQGHRRAARRTRRLGRHLDTSTSPRLPDQQAAVGALREAEKSRTTASSTTRTGSSASPRTSTAGCWARPTSIPTPTTAVVHAAAARATRTCWQGAPIVLSVMKTF